jgi:hypothetical protein
MTNEPFSSARRRRAVLAVAAVLLTIGSARAEEARDRRTEVAANAAAFESRRAAEQYLIDSLPTATAANPTFLTKADGTESRWLTKSIHFDDGPQGSVRVSMDEEFTQTKGGVSTKGTHQAVFSLADVNISVTTSAEDFTPTGEPAMGVLFTCATPKCVSATWSGQASSSDQTDISVQDAAVREQILAAFQFLKGAGKPPG